MFFLVVVVEWFQVFHSCFQSWRVCNLKNNWMLWKLHCASFRRNQHAGVEKDAWREKCFVGTRDWRKMALFVVHCWAIHLDIIKSMENGEFWWMWVNARWGKWGCIFFSGWCLSISDPCYMTASLNITLVFMLAVFAKFFVWVIYLVHFAVLAL